MRKRGRKGGREREKEGGGERERRRRKGERVGGREILWAVQHSQYDTSTLQYWSPHLLYPSSCAAVIAVLLRTPALQ